MINVGVFGLLSIIFLTLTGCSLPSAEQLEQKSQSFGVNLQSIDLVEYDNLIAQLSIKGSLVSNETTLDNTVKFHLSSTCRDSTVGLGTARSFLNDGIIVRVPTSGTITVSGTLVGLTKIYLSTNTLSDCVYLTDYTFQAGVVPPPGFSSTSPSSPSRETYTPLIFGTALKNSNLKFYSDSLCQTEVGSGIASEYNTVGIRLILPAESTTTIYGQTTDSQMLKSSCHLLTSFTHTTAGPQPPVFSSVLPLSPNNVTSSPVIRGTTSGTISSIKFYKDSSCVQQVGIGTADEFLSAEGIKIDLPANQTVSVFAKTFDNDNNPSLCTFMTSYLFDNVKPTTPLFSAALPLSPTRLTIFPKIYGFSSSDTAAVRLYNSPTCLFSQLIGSGTKVDFEGAQGISVQLEANSTNSIYAVNVDSAGNSSNCVFLTYYRHNVIPPDVPQFTETQPASPNNISSQPRIFGNSSSTTKNIYFYKDDTCTSGQEIGIGTAAEFVTTGISLTTNDVPNSVNTTSVYAKADDPEGNFSECVIMLNYLYSTALAPAPSFSNFMPSSPNNYSTAPLVFGTVDNSVTQISLYKDASCDPEYLLSTRSRNDFVIQGIAINVLPNVRTRVYGRSSDVYGNQSDCVLLSSYIHDNKTPLAPVFTSVSPTSPTSASLMPMLKGLAQLNDFSKLAQIERILLFDDLSCVNQVGTGLATDFISGSGVEASIQYNFINTLYAQSRDAAGNRSICTQMVNYSHGNRVPGKPVMTSILPGSPSYSRKTFLKGTIGSSTSIFTPSVLKVYKNNSCTQLLTTAAASDYTTSGVLLNVDQNTTTNIYAQVEDVVGNKSVCEYQTSFLHNDLGPQNLLLSQNPNGSVNVQWQPDSVANPTAKYAVKRSMKLGGPYSIIAWDINSNSYNDSSVSYGKTYYYVVSAYNSTGSSFNSTESSITVSSNATSPPISLTLSAQSQMNQLNWLASNGTNNLYYKVFRSTQSGGPYSLIKDKVYLTTYDDKNLTNSTVYYYVVMAINVSGQSIYSNEASSAPLAAPDKPLQLTVDLLRSVSTAFCPGGGPAVYLKWTAPNYFSGFNIRRGYASSNSNVILNNTGPITQNEYYDCTPDADWWLYPNGRDVYYTVEATWGIGTSMVSSIISNEIVIRNNANATIMAYPADQKIYLDFYTSSLSATSYQIWRSLTPPKTNQLGQWQHEGFIMIESSYAGTSYLDENLTNGQAYYYVIVPIFGASVQGWPSAVVLATPSAHSGSSINNLIVYQLAGGNTPYLSWSQPASYNYFDVYRSDNGGPFNKINAGNVNVNYYSDVAAAGVNGALFSYKIVPVFGGVNQADSNIVTYRYGVPSGFTATASATQVTLSWSKVTNAVSYDIYRSDSSGFGFTLIDTITSASGTITYANTLSSPASYPVVLEKGYYYKVKPNFSDATVGQFSVEASAVPGANSLSQVTGLTVTSVSANSIGLTWAKLLGNPTYRVFVSTSLGGTYTQVASQTATAQVVSSLSNNQTYYFKVSSASCVTNCFSDIVSATTRATGLQLSVPTVVLTTTGVKITIPPVNSVDHYNILRSTDGANFNYIVTTLSPSTTSHTDTSVTPGQQYFYRIEAQFTNPQFVVTSKSSNGITYGSTIAPPSAIYVSQMTNGTLSLINVSLGGNFPPQYVVYYGTSSGVYTASQTTATIPDLTAGTRYYAAVKSLNGEVESAQYSPEISFIPYLNFTAPVVTATSSTATVSWSSVAGATSYKLYRSENKQSFTQIQSAYVGTSYVDSAVVSGKLYSYKFIPNHSSGISLTESFISNEVSLIQPLKPENLIVNIQAAAPTSANLNWTFSVTEGSAQISGYRIYRSATSGVYGAALATVNNIQKSYTDSSLLTNQTYYYVVRSISLSGVESPNSNEVIVRTFAGPAGLTVVNNNQNIDLNWLAVSGASSYEIYRSYQSGGPYGFIKATNQLYDTDTNILNGQTYYYVVKAVFASGARSVNSNEVSITAVRTLNLQHAVELTDQPLASSLSGDVTFDRTQTTIDSSMYDGTVVYNLEVVATNSESNPQSVQFVDSNNNLVGSVTVPALTMNPTVLRSTNLTLTGREVYRLKLNASSISNSLQVLSAKLWITQTNATKTRIYVPLLSSSNLPSEGDASYPVESGNPSNWQVLNGASYYQKNQNYLKNLKEFNAWELEAIVSSSGALGMIGLTNITSQTVVDSSTIQFNNSNPQVVNATFNDGDVNFSTTENLHWYQVAYKCYSECDSGNINIFKAGLWIELENISSIEIFIRNSLGQFGLSGSSYLDSSRVQIDLSKYTNPIVTYKVTGVDAFALAGTGASSGGFELVTFGLTNSGQVGVQTIASSHLDFSGQPYKTQKSTGQLTLNSNDRFGLRLNSTNGAFHLNDSQFVIRLGY